MTKLNKKLVFLVLDGWGLSAAYSGNALKLAKSENFNYLWQTYPHWVLSVSPKESKDKIINSNLGLAIQSTGRFLPTNQEFINNKISDKSFFSNTIINDAISKCLNYSSSLHLIGLISGSGIYSDLNQLFALMQLAKEQGLKDIFIHAISDGVDTESRAVEIYINQIKKFIDQIGVGSIATLCGRKFIFDKEASFDKIVKSFKAITEGVGRSALDINQAVIESRKVNESDADILPTIMFQQQQPIGRVKDFDSIIFFNYDDESLRSLSGMFIGQKNALRSKKVYNISVTLFTDYFYLIENSDFQIAFPREDFSPNVAQIISQNHKNQIYISEQYKSPASIYSFCGGKNLLPGQENIIVQDNNDSKLASDQVFNQLTGAINSKKADFISANFSSADYFAHRGGMNDVISAVRNIDGYLQKIETAALANDYDLLITADHGFVEQLTNRGDNQNFLRSHSNNPIPLIHVEKGEGKKRYELGVIDNLLSEILHAKSTVCNIAPTILDILGLEKPEQMSGVSLLRRDSN